MYDVPFTCEVTRIFNYESERTCRASFYSTLDEAVENTRHGFYVRENEDLRLDFTCKDENARLYLDALDIVPANAMEVFEDARGTYCKPSRKGRMLFQHVSGGTDEYDALYVDVFPIEIRSQGESWFTTLNIHPKNVSDEEWEDMRNELEENVRGIAQDMKKRSLGIGTARKTDRIPPETLRKFLTLRKYAPKLLPVLIDIAKHPKSRIDVDYVKAAPGHAYKSDSRRLRSEAKHPGRPPLVTKKTITCDTQENRIAKHILEDALDVIREFLQLAHDPANTFVKDAKDVQAMLVHILTASWMQEVGEQTSVHVPNAFFMDHRYLLLYQLQRELQGGDIRSDFAPHYNIIWKQSSKLYELWCFLTVFQLLGQSYTPASGFSDILTKDTLFPELLPGTKAYFENERLRIELVFDDPLASDGEDTSENDPLYIAKLGGNFHNRPDILINVYDRTNDWYIGSVILECKYRKCSSFLSRTDGWSSLNQFKAYSNDARSRYLYGGHKLSGLVRPVRRVIVLTPDLSRDGDEFQDFNIRIRGMKPTGDDSCQAKLALDIEREIVGLQENEELFF